MSKKITVFTGHYGSGKTEIAVNFALAEAKKGKKTVICDMDVVNPCLLYTSVLRIVKFK